jgi:glycosyltransferase involved in cell wall biosynthesis
MVHLTAQGELDQARKWFPRGRGLVIPNLLDLDSFRSLPGPELAKKRYPVFGGGGPVMLFLSRVHYKKGIEPLLRALARELGVEDSVVFAGHVVGDLKLSLYQAADLFVLPTSQENFGFVFVESLACGTPLVTTKGVDIWPELESSGGALIESAEPERLASTLAPILADRDRLRVMGARGREWVFRWLDPARVLDQFEAMYRGAVG